MLEVILRDGTKTYVRSAIDLAYVIQGDDEARVVKVGRSRDPVRRVAGLLSGIPFNARLVAILGDGARREREMKELLASERMRGEWFKPSSALNEYLSTSRAENAVLSRQPLGEEFHRTFVQPAILEYLNGREPDRTAAGDYVYRLLHEGFSAVGARQNVLLTACPFALTPELLAGYVPLGFDTPTPQVAIPVTTDLQRAG